MKKILLFAAAALTMSVGCSKIQELINPDKGQEPVDDTTPVEITFNTNVTANLQTKGSGAVENFDGTQKLFIYGLNLDHAGVKEIANQEARADVDASDEGDVSGALTWADPTFAQFYNGTTDVYEFYGYHIDDATPATPFSETNYVSVITIDGTQDIMLAKANPEADLPASGEDYYDVYGAGIESDALTQDQKDARDKVYSAWSARRGVTPTLKFEHMLSKLTFSVVNRGSDDLTLQGIDINTIVDGTLTVVSMSAERNGTALTQGLVNGNTKGYLTLDMKNETLAPKTLADATGEADGGPVDDYFTSLQNGAGTKTATMMVFPDAEYDVVLNLTQEGQTTGRFVTVTIKDDLLKGYAYDLQITLYSLSNIKIEAALVDWEKGEPIGIDTEDGTANESETNPNA